MAHRRRRYVSRFARLCSDGDAYADSDVDPFLDADEYPDPDEHMDAYSYTDADADWHTDTYPSRG